MKIQNKSLRLLIIGIFISFIFSFPVILPFLHKGYFSTHDGEWAVVRAVEMFREVRDLQFPPRYSGALNFGYGYPLFNFAYPMPYYLTTFLHFLQVGFVDSVKLLFAASVVFSALFMFFASRLFWKSTLSGVVSAVFFIYFPYRFVDLYVRGSLGESLAFVIFPALFFFILKIVGGSSNRLIMVLIAFFYAALILTHNIMAVFFSIVLFFFLLNTLFVKRREVIRVVIFLIGGFGASSFFWLPALLEKQYILLSKIPIADRNLYYVVLDQLVIPRWGYGVPTDTNGFTYQLGFSHIIMLVLTCLFALFVWRKKRDDTQKLFMNNIRVILGSIAFFLFLLFPISAFVWKLPFLSEINYPWTVLGVIGFLISLLAGFFATQNATKYIVIFLAAASVLFVFPYAKPQYYVDRGDAFYLTNEATTTSSSELMPQWVKKMPSERAKQKVEIIQGEGQIKNVVYNSKMIEFSIMVRDEVRVRVNTIYYPGWQAKINGKDTVIAYDNSLGVIEVMIPPGSNAVLFSFGETPLRLASNAVSIGSLVGLLFFVIKKKKKNV